MSQFSCALRHIFLCFPFLTKRGSDSPVIVVFVLETFFSNFFRLRAILGLFSPFFHVTLLENYFLFNGVNGNLFIFV